MRVGERPCVACRTFATYGAYLGTVPPRRVHCAVCHIDYRFFTGHVCGEAKGSS